MQLKGWAITMGIGAAAGAVAILMMPKNNPARKLDAQAANNVEDAACKVTDKLADKLDLDRPVYPPKSNGIARRLRPPFPFPNGHSFSAYVPIAD